MGCGCADRRAALQRGASALVRGDAASAATAGRFVATSLAGDAARAAAAARTAASQQLAAARARLGPKPLAPRR